ncbi:MAG: ATP-dependent RNA helicase HrpA [Acidobacteriota bacterium]|nr:ATP-dependent RNA helicase HrpA [Acidobacteriota bacterium]
MRNHQADEHRTGQSGTEARDLLELRHKVISLASDAMLRDAYYTRERIVRLLSSGLPRKNPAKAAGILHNLKKRLEKSTEEKSARQRKKPRLYYPQELPIVRNRPEIVRAIKDNRVIIVSGETGCGKSTQLPKMCLEAGQGLAGKIACTQPRRLAAITIAQRISDELHQPLGQAVGYKIRFQDKTSPGSYFKILTDGMLLAETQADHLLTEYDTIIIDEAHERNLNIDFLIGLTHRLLEKRPELKVIITSATLEVEKFVKAFEHPPVFKVSGRLFPVEVMYFERTNQQQKKEESDYVDLAVDAVDFIRQEKQPGDILVFMPTEQDIMETCRRLQGRHYQDSIILPLFARMPAQQQKQIYAVKQGKIVVATNVAETSLTIPGIRYVVDTGLARLSQYQPSSGIHSLPVMPISRASAEQRKGRCGRVSEGLCLRLYSKEDFLARPNYTPPEILRSNLAEVILRMLDLDLGDPLKFPFLDPPTARSVQDGYRTLSELGAIAKTDSGYELTSLGRQMARLPLDPRLSRLLLEAGQRGCLEEVAIIAAALSIQDPRLRPLDKAADADRIQSIFQHPESDFLTLVNIWRARQSVSHDLAGTTALKKFARDYFLSYNRLREWHFVYEQIMEILEEQRIKPASGKTPSSNADRYKAIHQSILSGFISHLAIQKEQNIYQVARRQEAMLWPGSALFKKPAAWIVAAEMVRTNRLYLRLAARVNPAWAEDLAPHLCHYSYESPYWDKDRGQVRAKEKVSLFNLTIVDGRDVPFGQQDPEKAHQIFVEEALLNNQVNRPYDFLQYNQQVVIKIHQLEEKLRSRQILIPEQYLFDFYSGRLKGIYRLEALDQLIKRAGSDDFLRFKEENLYLTSPDQQLVSQFPDYLKILGHSYELRYRFSPGEEEDGVTILIPLHLVKAIPEALLTWPVPGLMTEKVLATLKALPKEYRKLLQPLSDTAEVIAKELKPASISFYKALSVFLKDHYKLDLPQDIWARLEIPRYLKMRMAIINDDGQEILAGRDLAFLCQLLNEQAKKPVEEESPGWKAARNKWEKEELAGWDEHLAEIPEEIIIDNFLKGYPALVADRQKFSLKLFKDKGQARQSHLQTVEMLLSRQFEKDLNFIQRSYALPKELKPVLLFFGGETTVKEEIISRVKKEVFQKNFRRRTELETYIKEKAMKELFEKGHQLFMAVQEILQEYHKAARLIENIEEEQKRARIRSAVPDILKEELKRLIPRNFVQVYPSDFLTELPRLVRALGIRAERARFSAEKDRAKATQVEPFESEYDRLSRLLRQKNLTENEQQLLELRWMIEEFKISVFAPEIKTAFPVSAKRLTAKIKEIEDRLELKR